MTIKGGNPKNGRSTRFRWLLTKQAQYSLDLLTLTGAFSLAYLLRFDFAIPKPEAGRLVLQVAPVMAIQFGMLILAGIYAFIWRYVGMAEFKAFINAALGSALMLIVIRLSLPGSLQAWRVPLSVIVRATMIAFGGVLGLRVMRRVMYEKFEKLREANGRQAAEPSRVLLVGAGRAGVMTVREIVARGDMELDVKGFVDDDPNKLG